LAQLRPSGERLAVPLWASSCYRTRLVNALAAPPIRDPRLPRQPQHRYARRGHALGEITYKPPARRAASPPRV